MYLLGAGMSQVAMKPAGLRERHLGQSVMTMARSYSGCHGRKQDRSDQEEEEGQNQMENPHTSPKVLGSPGEGGVWRLDVGHLNTLGCTWDQKKDWVSWKC